MNPTTYFFACLLGWSTAAAILCTSVYLIATLDAWKPSEDQKFPTRRVLWLVAALAFLASIANMLVAYWGRW